MTFQDPRITGWPKTWSNGLADAETTRLPLPSSQVSRYFASAAPTRVPSSTNAPEPQNGGRAANVPVTGELGTSQDGTWYSRVSSNGAAVAEVASAVVAPVIDVAIAAISATTPIIAGFRVISPPFVSDMTTPSDTTVEARWSRGGEPVKEGGTVARFSRKAVAWSS